MLSLEPKHIKVPKKHIKVPSVEPKCSLECCLGIHNTHSSAINTFKSPSWVQKLTLECLVGSQNKLFSAKQTMLNKLRYNYKLSALLGAKTHIQVPKTHLIPLLVANIYSWVSSWKPKYTFMFPLGGQISGLSVKQM